MLSGDAESALLSVEFNALFHAHDGSWKRNKLVEIGWQEEVVARYNEVRVDICFMNMLLSICGEML